MTRQRRGRQFRCNAEMRFVGSLSAARRLSNDSDLPLLVIGFDSASQVPYSVPCRAFRLPFSLPHFQKMYSVMRYCSRQVLRIQGLAVRYTLFFHLEILKNSKMHVLHVLH